MNQGHGLELVMYLAQAGCAIAQAAIFAYYYRVSRLEHLRMWGLSFVALAMYLVFALVGMDLGEPPADSIAVALPVSMASLVAAYLQVALLALGTMAVLGRHPPARRTVRNVLVASVLFGAVTALLFAAPFTVSSHRI